MVFHTSHQLLFLLINYTYTGGFAEDTVSAQNYTFDGLRPNASLHGAPNTVASHFRKQHYIINME